MTLPWAIFLIALFLGILLILLLLLIPPIKRHQYKTDTVKSYYHKVRKVVDENDLYLINEFKATPFKEESFHIDHLIIGNKYIYVIRDRYFPGVIVAKSSDEKWIFHHKKGRELIDNPLSLNRTRIARLSLMTGIDEPNFVSIILINNDAFISPMDLPQGNYIISLSKLGKLIEAKEKEAIPSISKQSSAKLVQDFKNIQAPN